ncbi:hypothetical protein F4775DRAFT_588962 [Biscogniauxia sp. FL1348]|nr:hypothetical protein F4775DRAFT_588962 [Biscogniauxia sp. FL1348]
MNPHDPQGSGPYGSDTSSFYSVRSGSVDSDSSSGSTQSFWSSSDSQSFVYVEDPRGCYGVRGAVTRKRDKRDDRRIRIAAHILSGPFAQSKFLYRSGDNNKKFGRCCEDGNGPCCRGGQRSRSVSRSRHHHHHRHPEDAFNGPPPPVPTMQHHHQGPPPPRPAPPPQHYHHGNHPAAPGFENGFIQIPPAGAGGAPMPPRPAEHDDAAWGWNTRGRRVEVFD